MRFSGLALVSLAAFAAAAPAPHGESEDAATVDAISNALYASWGIIKREGAELSEEQAATVDAISNALYASWGIIKRAEDLTEEQAATVDVISNALYASWGIIKKE
ncbi:Uncharacterized protein J7T55_014799 [Diaporthe amygdali]|uniref:uncharacterized protein n=1 Tax=Phomopsis amygdali TaxID=1214568 RepID=UPI0022FF21CE|nr:uncharacterized protein J7T55_014799 [Diaporthe amygdali]KAJ0109997.1 Uncharacterized protein J7T55_014799 [Diaporthe amygdali]